MAIGNFPAHSIGFDVFCKITQHPIRFYESMKKSSAHPFFDHLNQFVTISEKEFEIIRSYFETQNLKKKQLLMKADGPCDQIYFVLKGCVHMYFITERGTERTVQFALENWWITDFLAYQKQTSTHFFIQAIENTVVLSVRYGEYERLLHDFPQLERYFRIIFQIAYGSSIMKMKYLFDFSKEEIYFHFTEHFPEFAQRVPQYLIASFLGLTPEYVSEIRSKKRS